MNKFLFKSTDADLQKMLSILATLQKNMVYSTYKLDRILKMVKELGDDKGLQKQVDEFYEEDPKITPEEEQ